jgi:O-methyltransferase domain/Dimerisation domain
MAATRPGRDDVLAMSAGFQEASILAAAAELDVFSAIGAGEATAAGLAERLEADLRGLTMLLDALAALELLEKEGDRYRVPEGLCPFLCDDSPESVLPMILHRANIARAWSMLAWTVKAGLPAPRPSSIRGAAADTEAFVAAMHTASGPAADALVARLGPPAFTRLLDVGGASGTWTLAFLRARPGSTAVIFDLPHAVAQARDRLAGTTCADRVSYATGDFYHDELPAGADLAWVSAIVHQHSRRHNRALFAKVHRALAAGGTIAIRDVVMAPDRTRPLAGAMFAINMLANTATGATFSFAELAEDLQIAGFIDPRLAVEDAAMNSVVVALKQ